MTLHVFLSYARKDGEQFAVKLDSELTAQGIATWWDKRNIDKTQDFSTEIEKGIKGSDCVVACITRDTVRDDSFVRR